MPSPLKPFRPQTPPVFPDRAGIFLPPPSGANPPYHPPFLFRLRSHSAHPGAGRPPFRKDAERAPFSVSEKRRSAPFPDVPFFASPALFRDGFIAERQRGNDLPAAGRPRGEGRQNQFYFNRKITDHETKIFQQIPHRKKGAVPSGPPCTEPSLTGLDESLGRPRLVGRQENRYGKGKDWGTFPSSPVHRLPGKSVKKIATIAMSIRRTGPPGRSRPAPPRTRGAHRLGKAVLRRSSSGKDLAGDPPVPGQRPGRGKTSGDSNGLPGAGCSRIFRSPHDLKTFPPFRPDGFCRQATEKGALRLLMKNFNKRKNERNEWLVWAIK